MAECTGLWRRTLLIDADGAHDATPGVLWLQGRTAYVDSRGFAGRLHQSGNVFEWQRDIDLEPPGPFPDVGEMRWDGDVLVETGVHADYAEHWVRDAGSDGPCHAAFLRGPDDADGLLVRVGDQFGWAGGGVVVIGPVDGPQWDELRIIQSENEVHAGGTRWTVERSEGDAGT